MKRYMRYVVTLTGPASAGLSVAVDSFDIAALSRVMGNGPQAIDKEALLEKGLFGTELN